VLRFYFGQPPTNDATPNQISSGAPKVVTVASTIQPITKPLTTPPTQLPVVPEIVPNTTLTVEPTDPPPTPPSIIVSAESGLNVRGGAGTSYPITRVAPNGQQVELSGASENVDGFVWVQLTEGGWVQKQYLKQE
tara:strand:+ start:329 stop:733 length:405 start_codon:yes stop_codon:yes gene_type:complete